MKQTIAISLLLLGFVPKLFTQPFTDVVRLMHAAPISREAVGYEPWSRLNVQAGVQVLGPHYFLVSYNASRRVLESTFWESTEHPNVLENGLALGAYILPTDKPWRLQVFGRIQFNGQYTDGDWPDLQPAVLGVYQRKVNPRLLLGAGMYYARQLFGNFFIPIVDVQWQVGERTHLNLRIPQKGQLHYTLREKRWAAGAWFESTIQSYNLAVAVADHLKSSEICAGPFLEFMPFPSLALRLEPTLFLLQQLEWQDAAGNPIVSEERPTTAYFRVGMHYRVWQ